MFITKEQLNARLTSRNNVLNIISPNRLIIVPPAEPINLTPLEIPVPTQDHPVITDNLEGESDRQRAARVARNSIDHHEKHGEYTVNPNISNDIVRSTIGILANSGECTSREIQKEFGITKNQIVGAKNSKSSKIRDRIDAGKNHVSELALDKLIDTLGLLSAESMSTGKPKDIAVIASSLAKVVASMRPDSADASSDKAVNIVVYAPERRTLATYDTVDV